MDILVAGGAGYIGSHTCVELLNDGYNVIVVDDLSNSSNKAIDRIEEITGKKIKFYKINVCSKEDLEKVFKENNIDAVIQFAGFKAVGESVSKPLEYYSNNLESTLNICHMMKSYNVKNIIFSSSATVYGDPTEIPITENCPKGICTNPYGWTKWMTEQMLSDMSKADKELKVTLLRYFNPIGAHPSGLIGEDPQGIPNNLLPYIAQVAVGRLEKLGVFGDDYDTPDGTGIRDYIHVMDLARGHVLALKYMSLQQGTEIFNLGTGKGYSVLQVVNAFSKACKKNIPYEIKPRRAGDIACCYCDPKKAEIILGFKAIYGIDEMCADSWNWQKNNPYGYEK